MSIFNVSNEEAKRIRLLHESESQNKKISSVIKEGDVLNDETVTNTTLISEGPFSGRGVHATLCCSDMMLGYWASTCPLPPVITASNGNRGAMYLTIGKMTINGNTPQPGDYFKGIESQNGSPTGNNPNGESSGLIYRVTSTSAWNPLYSTKNFPSAGGCPSCPGISTWTCSPQGYMSSNYYTGGNGTCTELPTNCAPHDTEQDCQNSGDPDCMQPASYTCDSQGNCYDPGNGTGQFATLQDCVGQCEPDVFVCTQGSCVQNPTGNYPLTQQFNTLSDCQQNCTPLPNITYNCNNNGNCIPVQGAGGQYLTMADCQEECEYDGKWSCRKHDGRHTPDLPMEMGESNHFNPTPISGHHCVKDPNGQYNTKQECEADCPRTDRGKNCVNCKEGIMTTTQMSGTRECPPGFVAVTDLTQGPCVECQSQNCVSVGWGYGSNHFNSMAECQNSPTCGQGGYTCVGTGQNAQCQPDPNSTQTLQDCQANCPPQQNLWECDNGPNGCTQTANGTYQSQAACETACCQDVIDNYGWATNHPNATSIQACNRIYNQFGSIGSFNPNNLPFDDSCEYDFLIGIAGVCGVSQGYQNLINGFIAGNNGCYGNPNAISQGYGQGNPHQNSACGKVEQFCEAPIGNNPGPSTPTQWYKCQWTQQQALNGGCIC